MPQFQYSDVSRATSTARALMDELREQTTRNATSQDVVDETRSPIAAVVDNSCFG
ncbi:hypothetical protein [Bifidobacterium coryneforme]|uniref:hypothetical protein n=1 Tax=Bifidobacterium coryneforme TaxID=1687 RepID=UPI0012E051BA|nr:hypothetical protein [Bifidobacterium coryneforme]